jgi:glycerol-3-phosphate dehydrogenase
MAEDAVDEAIKAFKLKTKATSHVPDISGVNGVDPSVSLLNGSCQTHHIRLLGAHGYSTTLFINLIQHFGLETEVAKHLATEYGDRAWDVAALASPVENSPFPIRGQRLSPLYPYIDGEVRYAVRSEYAQTAADVLARRTRLSFLNAQAALQALPRVIDIMGDELKWSSARREAEWKDTVGFLASMGLAPGLLQVTREEVMQGLTGQREVKTGGEKGVSASVHGASKSKDVEPLKPSQDPVSQTEGTLP